MTEQEIQKILTEALENLFEIWKLIALMQLI